MSPAADGMDVAELVRRVLGAEALAGDPGAWAIRGLTPRAVALPADAGQAAELLRAASAEGVRVLPAGRGSWLGGGGFPGPVDLVVSTRRMDRIVQYEPADLTLTAEAGIGLDTLASTTDESDQWLPVDPPGDPAGSLGATLATASSGFLAARYGRVRDQVLGLTLVTGDGRVLELGGRVVKNVAGFDLVRLAVGSWGTLGLVVRATVRLHPTPRAVRHLTARADGMEELVEAARAVAVAPVVPARLELRETPGDSGRMATLMATLHGSGAAVDAEVRRLRERVPELEAVEEAPGPPEPARDPDLVVRMHLARAELGELVSVARTLGRLEGGRNVLAEAPLVYRADPGAGGIRVVVPNVRTDGAWADRWRDRLVDLRRTLRARGGALTVESAPRTIGRGLAVRAVPPAAAGGWTERIRDHFDPERILVPERLDFGGAIGDLGAGGDGTGEGSATGPGGERRDEWA